MIKVLSYGSGNVKAITNIYQSLNIPCAIACTRSDLRDAQKLIIPGVGAFDKTMTLLRDSGMLGEVNRLAKEEKLPTLGVCVGMQVMASSSDEGTEEGLGWIDGHITKLDSSKLDCKPHLPHMGWNSIDGCVESHKIFAEVNMESGFYFLHSYYFRCEHQQNILATTEYGEQFPAAVFSDNIYGFQFHPEKSHANGVNLFRNFANL